MSASRPHLDPDADGAFLDAIAGLDRVGCWLARVVDEATRADPVAAAEPAAAGAPDEPKGRDGRDGPDGPDGRDGPDGPDGGDAPLDALLGLVCLHRTLAWIVAAGAVEAAPVAPVDAAAWARELLR